MTRYLKLALLLSLSTLVGCSYFSRPAALKGRETAHLSATSIPALKMPPGVDSRAFQSAYPVSNKAYTDAEKNVSLTPPGLQK